LAIPRRPVRDLLVGNMRRTSVVLTMSPPLRCPTLHIEGLGRQASRMGIRGAPALRASSRFRADPSALAIAAVRGRPIRFHKCTIMETILGALDSDGE
jgi:hypothetical protein